MATPTNFKTLNAQPVITGEEDFYLYGIDNAGLLEGRVLASQLLGLGIQPDYIPNSGGALEAGKKYRADGTTGRTLPAITADGQVITIVRDDDANGFTITPDGSDTIAGDPTFNVDVDLTKFDLVAKLSTNDWRVYV